MQVFAFPQFQQAVQEWFPKVGDVVSNFGAIVRVLKVDPTRGLLVVIMPIGGQGGAGQRYFAQPSKCLPVA